MSGVVGLVLAAGAGTRLGEAVPKPAVPFRGRPLLTWPLAALATGGVEDVVVVLGAGADAVATDVERGGGTVVVCAAWREGLSASLRAGVQAAAARGAPAVVVVLGDQPLLDGAAVARVVAARDPRRADAVRATYDGVPGHPVAIGRDHWSAVRTTARGDRGARDHLRVTPHRLVECGDLATGADVDSPTFGQPRRQ